MPIYLYRFLIAPAVVLDFAVGAFATIFAIVNPVAMVPIFEAATEGFNEEMRRRVVYKICLIGLITFFVFGLFGQWIFSIYGISIPAFKVAGGVLLFSVAYDMLHAKISSTKFSKEDRISVEAAEDVGIVLLGIPLFAGPGSITTIMILVSESVSDGNMFKLVAVFAAIMVTVVISYFLLRNSYRVFSFMKRSGANAFSRIMGILLSAVAVSFVFSGVLQFIQDAGLV
jgi:multiple antibiotic resistance protein